MDGYKWSVYLGLQWGSDRLFIIHTGKNEAWKGSGPLVPDMDTALANWPRTVLSLKGSLQSNLALFLEKYSIDIVVLPDDFPKQGAVQLGSVADWVKQNVTKPFILIRPGSVLNEKLRLKPCDESLAPLRSGSVSYHEIPGRRIAIAYPSFSVGLKLIDLAKRLVLTPLDEIYVVHCFGSQSNAQSLLIGGGQKALKQTAKVFRTLTKGHLSGASKDLHGNANKDAMQSSSSGTYSGQVTEETSEAFGAKELKEFPKVNLDVVLRGDTRSSLVNFCKTEAIEILIISTRTSGRLMKTLSGGSVSAFLIDKAPCPCLVAPYKSLGLSQEQEEYEEVLTPHGYAPEVIWPQDSHKEDISPAHGKTSPDLYESTSRNLSSRFSPTETGFAALQTQLEDKDRVIARLQEEINQLRLANATEKDEKTHSSNTIPKTY